MLYIVATPIGNLEEISLRAIRILKEVDLVLCEDTRKSGFLLKRLEIKKPLISFFEHNEVKKIPQVIEELKKGKRMALVSSAGTPTISDPGYKLIRACRKESIPVTSIPGPSSIVNALSLSSIAHEKFVFMGYLPRKSSQRQKLFEEIKSWDLAVVFFESPYRLNKSLVDLKSAFGNRKVAVVREMTKKFEEAKEGGLDEGLSHFSSKKPKGEVVVIVSGK